MHRRKTKRGKGSFLSQLWKIGLAVLIPLIALDVYLLIDSKIFNVKTVDVSLDKISCTTEFEIKRESAVSGQKFFLLDEKNIGSNLKGKFFCIKSVNISRTFL